MISFKPILREIPALLRAGIPFILVFVFCLVGAFFSYQNSRSYQLATFLGVVGKNITTGQAYSTNEEVLSAVESGLRTKDKYLKFFYTEDEFNATWKSLETSISAKYGILLGSDGTIKDILKHSPNRSKLHIGDKLVAVSTVIDSSKFLETLNFSSKEDKSITVRVQRTNTDAIDTVELFPFKMRSAYVENLDGHLIITIYYFRTETTEILVNGLNALTTTPKSITIDVSQCPGGKVKSLTTALSFFLPEKSRLFYEERKNSKLAYVTNRKPVLNLATYPNKITVLQSKRTASSAEILVGVLNYHLASKSNYTSLGETTYGKWTTVQFIKFLKGGMLYSVGRVFLPDQKTYEGFGIPAKSMGGK